MTEKVQRSVLYVLQQTKCTSTCTVTPPKIYYHKRAMRKNKLRCNNTLSSQRLCHWRSWKWLDLLTTTLFQSFQFRARWKNIQITLWIFCLLAPGYAINNASSHLSLYLIAMFVSHTYNHLERTLLTLYFIFATALMRSLIFNELNTHFTNEIVTSVLKFLYSLCIICGDYCQAIHQTSVRGSFYEILK